MVFLPYCTGDVHTGNNVIVYKDPDGQEPDLEFHHNGHNNVIAATTYLSKQFPQIDRLFVTGCSAGGAGSIINYFFFRTGLNAASAATCSTTAARSSPAPASRSRSHAMIRSSWDVDSIFTELPPEFQITDDFGAINTLIADEFPEDRLSTVYFQRDYNYSRYSYENFYPENSKDDIHMYWAADTDLLVDLYETRDNLGYYLPYWRASSTTATACRSPRTGRHRGIEEQRHRPLPRRLRSTELRTSTTGHGSPRIGRYSHGERPSAVGPPRTRPTRVGSPVSPLVSIGGSPAGVTWTSALAKI
jgi:hypothetical protein